MIVLRLLVALPPFGSVVVYLTNPAWMAWGDAGLPLSIRQTGLVLACMVPPVAFWVLRSLGSNVSETVLTKADHSFVTHGPYRWVRHPLYTAGIALVGIVTAVVPREEAELIDRFGDDYLSYINGTGRLLPWIR